jgi:excisionase family DNA binding protein
MTTLSDLHGTASAPPAADAALPTVEAVSAGAVDDRVLLSVVEAARRLGIGRSLMYELLGSGEVRSIHIGRLHKVPVAALFEFVARKSTR